MEFDLKIKAYIEANQSYADELFIIARQHRMTYILYISILLSSW